MTIYEEDGTTEHTDLEYFILSDEHYVRYKLDSALLT